MPWWPYDSKSCEARQETQREAPSGKCGPRPSHYKHLGHVGHAGRKIGTLHKHSRPENFIFIGFDAHSIKYVCILGTDLH